MSVDELRSGLARLAGTVVPEGQPYGLLIRQARRRRRARLAGLGTAAAAALTVALVGPTALAPGGGSGPSASDGYPVTSEWAWRLLESPPRGNLAADPALLQELTRAFDEDREEVGISDALPKVRVLFVDESSGFRQVVVAYHSDTSASLVMLTGPRGASVRQLHWAVGNLPVTPLSALGLINESSREAKTPEGAVPWLLGLAPVGCEMSTTESASIATNGTIRRRWKPVSTRDYVLKDQRTMRGWWRVECDGIVRQSGPIGFGIGEVTGVLPGKPVARPSGPTPGESPAPWGAGSVAEAGLGVYQALLDRVGLPAPSAPAVRWSGRLADGDDVVVVGPRTGVGPVVLHNGENIKTMMALAGADDAKPDDEPTMATSRADWSLTATAVAGSADLIAVRVPERAGGHATIGDRLLVVPPPTAVRVVAVDKVGKTINSADVVAGAATLSLPVGQAATLRALDDRGEPLATATIDEPDHGERLFGEQLTLNW